MSNNLENERSVTTSKMYPIDLAPQKITIMKNVPNSEVKMTHLVPGQAITTGTGQIITHTGPLALMRPSTQIISSNVSSQPHMIISSSPILQGSQINSQGTQMLGQGSQIISKAQLLGSNAQIVSPGTQIISQGTQLNAQLGNNSSGPSGTGPGNTQVNVSSSGSQVLNVGGLVSATGNLVVSSTVRTLPPSVRVLPPLPHHNARPAVLSNVSNAGASGVVVTKALTSHVPRGPGIAASLAVPRVATRPITPVSQTMPISSLGTAWSSAARGVRGAVVYTRAARPTLSRATPLEPLPAIVTLPSTSVLTSSSVITGLRTAVPRPASAPAHPAPRPVPLVQRNYQPAAKLVGVASVGVRGAVGNSAPAQLYYEVPRPAPDPRPAPPQPFQLNTNNIQSSVNVANAVRASPENRPPPASVSTPAVALTAPPRPSILRKRDVDESPTKQLPTIDYPPPPGADTLWEEGIGAAGGGGSTTESAASSPAPDDEPSSPPPPPRDPPLPQSVPAPQVFQDISPRKKPRKQLLATEVRQCEFPPEEAPATPPPVPSKPPPKRPQLRSQFVCGWRATALHFVRPTDVRRREPRPKDILAIASQKHVLANAEGWKVHHLTQQMSDLVALESDVGAQLSHVLRTLESAPTKVQNALEPHTHMLFELVKGNMQRSQIVCEGVQEAREDILRVFTHRTFVSDILTRQADKRCFRKHRSQS